LRYARPVPPPPPPATNLPRYPWSPSLKGSYEVWYGKVLGRWPGGPAGLWFRYCLEDHGHGPEAFCRGTWFQADRRPLSVERALPVPRLTEQRLDLELGETEFLRWDPTAGEMHAAGRLGTPRLAEALVANLDQPGLGGAASASLAHLGEGALPVLRSVLEEPGREPEVRRRVLRVLGKLGGPGARDTLAGILESPDPEERQHAARALLETGYRLPGRTRLLELLRRESAEATWTYAAYLDVEGAEGCEALADGLIALAWRRREHVVRLMALRYRRKLLVKLVPRMMSSSPRQRAYALEVLDNLVAGEVRDRAFPILDDLRPGQRLRRLAGDAPPRPLSVGARLIDVIRGGEGRATPWLRAAALWAARSRGDPAVLEAARGALEDPEPLVRETALATLASLAEDEARELAGALAEDTDPGVARLASRLAAGYAA